MSKINLEEIMNKEIYIWKKYFVVFIMSINLIFRCFDFYLN